MSNTLQKSKSLQKQQNEYMEKMNRLRQGYIHRFEQAFIRDDLKLDRVVLKINPVNIRAMKDWLEQYGEIAAVLAGLPTAPICLFDKEIHRNAIELYAFGSIGYKKLREVFPYL